ncbi:FecR domain-containing protein [Sinomicrobium kalidii]|uniref:FecR family protein n=1 Tax=Sinomicrobium kalidii TaxID=2900738 RepID=UPI001E4199C1|nr:FecR domain-containing protein [Sinomicrobium kalidii]UGU17637.1 FecR domain-containing protein [Sinomicrobium kalidii]
MKKYLNGTITKREETLLEQFDSSLLSKNEKKVFKDANDKKRIQQRLSGAINNQIINGRKKERLLLNWRGIAASVVLILGLGYISYHKVLNNKPEEQPVPRVVKTTDWGQKLNLTLADGTKVRLNSGSTIKFPERFTGGTREVELTGEAFFNVAKNPDKPFVIRSGEVNTTVLGTSFNVNTYPDHREITVTVATGKVRVASKNKEVFLAPNEQGIFDKKSNHISKEKIDIATALQWKDGIIHFEDTTLAGVAESLERWYGVTFVFENEKIKDCHLTATYDNEVLAAVLESIVHTKKGLQYEYLEDNNILIKGRCTD